MEDYIWVESAGTTAEPEASVVKAQFGDGYRQVAPAGLNWQRQVWTVRHASIEVAIADEIEAFIRPKLEIEAFNWMPPRQGTALRFVCTSFQRTIDEDPTTHSITMRFEQDFAP